MADTACQLFSRLVIISINKKAHKLYRCKPLYASFNIHPGKLKDLLSGKISLDDLTELDFSPSWSQKGVDMKLGVDICSVAYKHQVDQIILIAGDTDFVPAAKIARREGLDVILDPMWAEHIADKLSEHVDGIRSCWKKKDEK